MPIPGKLKDAQKGATEIGLGTDPIAQAVTGLLKSEKKPKKAPTDALNLGAALAEDKPMPNEEYEAWERRFLEDRMNKKKKPKAKPEALEVYSAVEGEE